MESLLPSATERLGLKKTKNKQKKLPPNQDAVYFILFIYSKFVLLPNSSLFKSDLLAKREAEFSAS